MGSLFINDEIFSSSLLRETSFPCGWFFVKIEIVILKVEIEIVKKC